MELKPFKLLFLFADYAYTAPIRPRPSVRCNPMEAAQSATPRSHPSTGATEWVPNDTCANGVLQLYSVISFLEHNEPTFLFSFGQTSNSAIFAIKAYTREWHRISRDEPRWVGLTLKFPSFGPMCTVILIETHPQDDTTRDPRLGSFSMQCTGSHGDSIYNPMLGCDLVYSKPIQQTVYPDRSLLEQQNDKLIYHGEYVYSEILLAKEREFTETVTPELWFEMFLRSLDWCVHQKFPSPTEDQETVVSVPIDTCANEVIRLYSVGFMQHNSQYLFLFGKAGGISPTYAARVQYYGINHGADIGFEEVSVKLQFPSNGPLCSFDLLERDRQIHVVKMKCTGSHGNTVYNSMLECEVRYDKHIKHLFYLPHSVLVEIEGVVRYEDASLCKRTLERENRFTEMVSPNDWLKMYFKSLKICLDDIQNSHATADR